MKFFISYILIFTLVFPASLYADPPTPDDSQPSSGTLSSPSPRIMGIREGQPAPFSGVLLNPLAAARIFTDKNFSTEECDLRIKYNVDLETARMNLLLESSRVSMESLNQKYTSIIQIKDDEIKRLSDIASGTNDYSTLWFAGGILAGIGLTIAIVYAVDARN
jgi:hypothetical protein